MLRIDARAKTRSELDLATNPTNARQPESIPYVYFDTQSYPAAGQGGPLTFFASTQTDKSLGNLEQAGTIPDPYYFEIVAFNLDFLALPLIQTAGAAASAATGVGNDLSLIFNSARAFFTFTLAGKEYLRVPATYLHCSGGPITFNAGAFTATTQLQFTNNSFPDGGFYIDKKIILPPKQAFSAALNFQATLVPISVATNIRIGMAGVLHRRVL